MRAGIKYGNHSHIHLRVAPSLKVFTVSGAFSKTIQMHNYENSDQIQISVGDTINNHLTNYNLPTFNILSTPIHPTLPKRTPLSRLRGSLFSQLEEGPAYDPPPRTNSCPTSLKDSPHTSPPYINTGAHHTSPPLPERQTSESQSLLDIMELLPFCEFTMN